MKSARLFAMLLLVVKYCEAYNITVPSGANSTLENYLCGGLPLPDGTSLLLEAGEHLISDGPICSVQNLNNVTIKGAGRDETVVRCADGGRGFKFFSVINLTLASMTLIGCGQNMTIFTGFESLLIPVVLYLNSSAVTMKGVTFSSFYGLGVFGYAVYNSTLTDVHFRDCAEDSCAGVYLYATSATRNVAVQGCIFEKLKFKNSDVIMGAGMTLFSLASVRVNDCRFKNNSGDYGAIVMFGVSSNITNCTFEELSGGAITSYLSTLNIVNSTFSRNFAKHGAAINTDYNYQLKISGSTFDGNVADEWGGAINLFKPLSSAPLNIINSVFTKNVAQSGGAIFIFNALASSTVVANRSTFRNNSASIGAAICAVDFRASYGSPSYNLRLIDVVVVENHCQSCIAQQNVMGAAIYYTQVSNVILESSNGKGNVFVGNSPGGAIQGLAGGLHLRGSVLFRKNSGVNGGAIGLLNNANLYFYPNSNIEFYENTAATYGGAIYIQGDPNIPKSVLIECAMHFMGSKSNYSITFHDNRASLSGQSIYAAPIYNCTLEFPDWSNSSSPYINHPSAYYEHVLNVSSTNEISNAQVLSFPVDVLLCGCGNSTECDLTEGYKIFTYPGRTVQLKATSVDSMNHTSPAVVYTSIQSGDRNTMLAPQQNVQWIQAGCDTIEYEIYGKGNTTFDLLLSTFMGDVPTVIKVTMKPCEPGFVLNHDDKTGSMQCVCSEFLTSSGVKCDLATGNVNRGNNKWVGVYSNNLSAVATICPEDYCKSELDAMSLATADALCDNNRQGLLCGRCSNNMSVVFGSSECQLCSNLWLLTILFYAALGIMLVAFLFLLNVTVTQGAIYGIIFYANIIQVNASIFFNQPFLNPLQIIVSFINLDLGFPLCFYDRMDDAAKTGLQFVFPTYLFTLTITVILACRYCLCQPNGPKGRNSCCSKFNTFIRTRAVSVLATLIYLSYSKLLRTVIQIFTFATVKIENGTSFRVWFYDGTIRYLEGKHEALFIIAMATSVFFLFPFTLALTLIPIIDRFSEHNQVFNWINHKANLLKPMIDAYYAPYKGQWRSWLGVRLWLLVILYVPTPIYGSDQPDFLMYIHSIILVAFLYVQGFIKPFARLRNDNNSKVRYLFAQYYNWIDSFFMLDYTVLAFTASYLLSNDSNVQHLGITVATLVGVPVVMFVIVLFHRGVKAIKSIPRSTATNNENAVSISNILYDNLHESTMAEQSSSGYSDKVPYVIVTENDFRESLLDSL